MTNGGYLTLTEVSYEIAIPITCVRSLLSIAYADDFSGQLLKAGDVSPAMAITPTPETV